MENLHRRFLGLEPARLVYVLIDFRLLVGDSKANLPTSCLVSGSGAVVNLPFTNNEMQRLTHFRNLTPPRGADPLSRGRPSRGHRS